MTPRRAAPRVCAALLAALLAALVELAPAQTQPTPWDDVCQAVAYASYVGELCPQVFMVSSLSFNPHGPRADSNLTLILQPSLELPPPGSGSRTQYLDLRLPGFDALGMVDPLNANLRVITVAGTNPVGIGLDAATAYNSFLNGVFHRDARYNMLTGVLRLVIVQGNTMQLGVDTEIRMCCFRLPLSSAKDNTLYTLEAPTSDDTMSIPLESIKSTPEIDPGYQWDYLQVAFNPPVSMQLTVISLTVQAANDLMNRARITLIAPSITRVIDESGVISFNTAGSGDGTDWMLFDHEALWNATAHTLTYFLREGQVFQKGRTVTLHTEPGEFRLPVDLEANAESLVVEARSFDGVDEIIAATPVQQSSRVPHVMRFEHSELRYLSSEPYGHTDVSLLFRTNRPLFAGQTVYMRLAGFRAQVIEVPMLGETRYYFEGERARFHLPANVIELRVHQTIYSNEELTEITFSQLILPAALYANDTSLLIWNSDPAAEQQPIDMSPEVGGGYKTFLRSQILFEPMEPRLASNITFIIQPSIVMYQGDQIVMHLYGFVCQNPSIPLLGADAALLEGSAAQWFASDFMLVLTVGTNMIITNTEALIVTIGLGSNFRLPPLLSRNDGTLRMEAKAAEMIMPDLSWRTTGVSPHLMVIKEQMKKSPAIGDTKLVLGSSIEFETIQETPLRQNQLARVKFSFVLNCDVLPNSTINITLGGLYRDPPCANNLLYSQVSLPNGNPCRSGEVTISGENAPLFSGTGYWDQHEVKLSIFTIPMYIYAGEQVRFFLERDMYFRLPAAAYTNDPSFRLVIPGAGIAEQQFMNTTKFAVAEKGFGASRIIYGDAGSVWYPSDVAAFHFEFQPNVNLPSGSIVRLTLPGFTHPTPEVPLSAPPPQEQIANRRYLVGSNWQYAYWDQLAYTLDIHVPIGDVIESTMNVIKILVTATSGFMLPSFALEPNDPRLTIACIRNQRIYEESIQTSPRIVRRTFLISQFIYRPPIKQSIFLLEMKLQPSVNITPATPLILELPGFRNSLSKQLIEVRGADRYRIVSSMGRWNESTQFLTLEVDSIIPAFTELDLRIEESQGFMLPSRLDENDEQIRIVSVGNIDLEPIKISPMVGNMPSSSHRFCMYQYEVGVRSRDPICPSAVDCDPPLTDPCNPAELTRCGCNPRLDEVFNLTVNGFNLREDDHMYFIEQDQLCGTVPEPKFASPFSAPTGRTLSASKELLAFGGMSSASTGYYRMCYVHAGMLFDIGSMVVRPSCASPSVQVGGTCVEHCPKTKIMVAGECHRDGPALEADDAQAYMLAVKMAAPDVGDVHITDRHAEDAEVRYFNYRYIYELARLLNADPLRIQVASLSKGVTGINVNTVFETVGDEDAIASSKERSPMGLISLLNALRSDTSSLMYNSQFFSSIDKPTSMNQVVTRQWQPEMIAVRLCPDNIYRVMCPYNQEITSQSAAFSVFILGVLCIPVVLGALCMLAWRIDFDHPGAVSEDVMEKLRADPRLVDVEVQVEFARSWLEGRFTGEEWQRARRAQVLALGN